MSILVGQNTRLLCQGMTGWAGTYHTNRMIQYGTKVVAGVTPGKGGKSHLDVPIFDSVAEAMRTTGANASAVFVPPDRAAGAMIEAIEAEMPLVVAVTERVPILDMIRVREALAGSRTRLVGPNSQGVLAPGVCQVGVMATDRAYRGTIGRGVAIGIIDERSHQPAHGRRPRPIGDDRDRGRPRPWHELRRLPEAVLR
ncbi:MAG: succinyl-CoA synthetase alpha subunit [Alphaproteobacteria bacterium]|nr:succinyl-CoA synthetase alpha subunit [Alphaproteobacteria bacterium]